MLVSQTMFSIYNSISNLGALNLGSVVSVALIDQLALRPFLGLVLLITAKIIMLRFRSHVENQVSNQVVNHA